MENEFGVPTMNMISNRFIRDLEPNSQQLQFGMLL
jgi:hypothetical protein